MAKKMSVGAYYDWYFDGSFLEPQLQYSIYDKDAIANGTTKIVIERSGKIIRGMLGIKFRTEASGKWSKYFKFVTEEIFASDKTEYLPMYWIAPGEGTKVEKVRKSAPLLRCIENALWGNGTPEEHQITTFFATLLKWDELLNNYPLGINGMAFASNYFEFIADGQKPFWGTDRSGPIVRRTSAKKIYSKGEPITPFLLANGGANSGPNVVPGTVVIAASTEQGQLLSGGWCGLADGIQRSGKELEILMVKGSLSLGLERNYWGVNPAPKNSPAWIIKNRTTGQQSFAVISAVGY